MTAFVRVVEHGSFARAAERLSMSTSAVSRQVAELEAHLDARLLNRTTRRISLTEAGRSFFERSIQLLADLEEAEGDARTAGVTPKASDPCDVPHCVLCNSTGGLNAGSYLDSGGSPKTGFCTCQEPNGQGMRTWTCASETAWPCPLGKGC